MGKLKNAIRNIALTTKLPCNPKWYTENVIDYGLNNEVEVYPMTHSDEILMHNPDALFSNNAISKIISSCVPAVKNVSKVYMPDIETLLLAIKIASVGDELEVYNVCPECFEKYNLLSEEERNKLIEEKKLFIEPQAYIFDARTCLEQVDTLPDEFPIKINDNIKVYVKPLTLEESTKYELDNFMIQNRIQHYIAESKNIKEDVDALTDFDRWQENREKNEGFNQLLTELDGVASNMLKSAIKYITLNDEILSDEEDINDLLDNISSEKYELIKKTMEEANKSRLNKSFNCKCNYCGYEWSNVTIDFNFSNFFGKGS